MSYVRPYFKDIDIERRRQEGQCLPLDQKKNKLSVWAWEVISFYTPLCSTEWQLYPRSGGNELRPRSGLRGFVPPPSIVVSRLHMPGLRVFSWTVTGSWRSSVSRCRDNVSRQVCSITPLRRSHSVSASSATEISENWTLYSEANLLPSLV